MAQDSTSGWTSPAGIPIGPSILAKVDLEVLAELYRAETEDLPLPQANSATRHAWHHGYLNPRTA